MYFVDADLFVHIYSCMHAMYRINFTCAICTANYLRFGSNIFKQLFMTFLMLFCWTAMYRVDA